MHCNCSDLHLANIANLLDMIERGSPARDRFRKLDHGRAVGKAIGRGYTINAGSNCHLPCASSVNWT